MRNAQYASMRISRLNSTERLRMCRSVAQSSCDDRSQSDNRSRKSMRSVSARGKGAKKTFCDFLKRNEEWVQSKNKRLEEKKNQQKAIEKQKWRALKARRRSRSSRRRNTSKKRPQTSTNGYNTTDRSTNSIKSKEYGFPAYPTQIPFEMLKTNRYEINWN